MRLAAFILNIVFTVICGILIIPLVWMIPMTIRCYKIYKGDAPSTVGFGVCDLIFCNIFSGILLLCDLD